MQVLSMLFATARRSRIQSRARDAYVYFPHATLCEFDRVSVRKVRAHDFDSVSAKGSSAQGVLSMRRRILIDGKRRQYHSAVVSEYQRHFSFAARIQDRTYDPMLEQTRTMRCDESSFFLFGERVFPYDDST